MPGPDRHSRDRVMNALALIGLFSSGNTMKIVTSTRDEIVPAVASGSRGKWKRQGGESPLT